MTNFSEMPSSENIVPASPETGKENKARLYENTDYVTLYRYENPEIPYDEGREGVVSKKTLIGTWFTDNLNDFKTYVHMRPPRGRLVVVRVPKAQLGQFDASTHEETSEMDIEKGNYIIPNDIQMQSRVEIPLEVKSQVPKKFLFKEWKEIDALIDVTLTDQALLERLKK